MAHTYEELKGKTIAQLREIAAETNHESLKGYTQFHKDHLLGALGKALGIEMHEHHEVKGINKAAIKARIKELKVRRDEAISARDRDQIKHVRRNIRRLKRAIHKATV